MVMVDIYVPALCRTYDFELNTEERVGELAREISEILREECLTEKGRERDVPREKDPEGDAGARAEEDPAGTGAEPPSLYSLEQERMLPPRETLAGCGIRNGFRMILC